MAAQRPLTRRRKTGLGIGAGVLALGAIAGLGSHSTSTTPASDAHAAATSTAMSTAAPTTHSVQALRAATTVPTTSSAVTTTAAPKPLLSMTCPAGGTDATPEFGRRITAATPFTVVIDYGDGDRYTNDDQHLGAIFSHTYSAGGSFAVSAVLTDATGQTAEAGCTYSWTKPAPAPVVSSHSGTSSRSSGSGTSSSVGGSGGDTYTNVDGNEVHSPVEAPSAPAGASAHGKDGTWSFSRHRQGTCSGHGGVAAWL